MNCCPHGISILNLWFVAAAWQAGTVMRTAVFTVSEAGVLPVGQLKESRQAGGRWGHDWWLSRACWQLAGQLSGNSLFLNQPPSLIDGVLLEMRIMSRLKHTVQKVLFSLNRWWQTIIFFYFIYIPEVPFRHSSPLQTRYPKSSQNLSNYNHIFL